MVFNVTTDLLMLGIPVPFIINVRVTRIRKAMLVSIFSLGIFVILAAVLSKYYNFTMSNTTIYMVWDIRETGTSICVANIMCLWPLLRKMFGWSTFSRSSARSKSSQQLRSTPTPELGAVIMVDHISGKNYWDEESAQEVAPQTVFWSRWNRLYCIYCNRTIFCKVVVTLLLTLNSDYCDMNLR